MIALSAAAAAEVTEKSETELGRRCRGAVVPLAWALGRLPVPQSHNRNAAAEVAGVTPQLPYAEAAAEVAEVVMPAAEVTPCRPRAEDGDSINELLLKVADKAREEGIDSEKLRQYAALVLEPVNSGAGDVGTALPADMHAGAPEVAESHSSCPDGFSNIRVEVKTDSFPRELMASV